MNHPKLVICIDKDNYYLEHGKVYIVFDARYEMGTLGYIILLDDGHLQWFFTHRFEAV